MSVYICVRPKLGAAFLAMILLGVGGSLRAQTWSYSDVDLFGGGSVGACAGSSLSFDSENMPHILDYHPRVGNTHVNHSYWENGQWQHEQVVAAGAGLNSGPAAAIDSLDQIHVAFLNDSQNLGYAFYNGQWQIETVDPTSISTSWIEMVLDTDGNPHIAYTGTNQSQLKYARKSGDEWIIETFANGGGSVTSIVMDSLGHPHILSWLPGTQYRYFDGTQWQTETLGIGGTYSSLALDSLNRPQISYYSTDGGSYDLRFMTRDSGTWVHTTVDPGSQQDKRGWDTHISADQEGVLHIAYFCHNMGLIKHAWGNGQTWQTEIIDNVGIWYSSIDLIVDGTGLFVSYYDDGEGALRLATNAAQEIEAPAYLTAQVVNVNDVQLNWTAAQSGPFLQLLGYNIYQDGSQAGSTPADATSFGVYGLPPGAHDYYVCAVYAAGISDPCPPAGVVIELVPPANLTAIVNGGNIDLAWQTPAGTTNVTHYRLYRNGDFTAQTTDTGYTDPSLPEDTYTYQVAAVYNLEFESPLSNEVTVAIVPTTEDTAPAFSTALKGNFPNPFNPDTRVSFSLKERGPVTLQIFNARGELVRTLVTRALPAGDHMAAWDGRDARNRPVASGIYQVRMRAGGYSAVRKMILLK